MPLDVRCGDENGNGGARATCPRVAHTRSSGVGMAHIRSSGVGLAHTLRGAYATQLARICVSPAHTLRGAYALAHTGVSLDHSRSSGGSLADCLWTNIGFSTVSDCLWTNTGFSTVKVEARASSSDIPTSVTMSLHAARSSPPVGFYANAVEGCSDVDTIRLLHNIPEGGKIPLGFGTYWGTTNPDDGTFCFNQDLEVDLGTSAIQRFSGDFTKSQLRPFGPGPETAGNNVHPSVDKLNVDIGCQAEAATLLEGAMRALEGNFSSDARPAWSKIFIALDDFPDNPDTVLSMDTLFRPWD
jgi:hypothetical protein